MENLHCAARCFCLSAQCGQSAALYNGAGRHIAVVEIAEAPAGRSFLADDFQPRAARVAHQICQAFVGSGFHKLRTIRIPRRKHTASLNGHADGVRSAGELFKRVNALFIRILPQQQPNILSPCGADAFSVSLRSSQKLPGLQKRVADLVVNAGLGTQDLLFPRRILHVLPILPKSPVHGFQTKIVLFQFLFELRFLSDIRAGNLVNSFSGHPQPHALKAPRLAILQRDDGLRFNHFPENVFWKMVEPQPIVTLENGQTWSFERVRLGMSGKTVYQITGTNITKEAQLKQELEKDNLRLKAMNRRLRQYGQDVQDATREKEILRAKTRVHDQIGHALLQTRQLLAGTQGDTESVCAAWRQNVRLLLGKYSDEQCVDTFEQLTRAANAIGVTIERRGVFPAGDTDSTQLVETAAHECLTNLVRHAGGTRLEIIGKKTASGWRFSYLNDGNVPAGPIVEGSGLAALRAQTEAAGGAMEVFHAPRFMLVLTLPEERQETL